MAARDKEAFEVSRGCAKPVAGEGKEIGPRWLPGQRQFFGREKMPPVSGLIPARFLVLTAHLVIVITIFWSRENNVRASLPLQCTQEEFDRRDTEMVVALSVTLGLFVVELAGFLSGVSMFNNVQSLLCILRKENGDQQMGWTGPPLHKPPSLTLRQESRCSSSCLSSGMAAYTGGSLRFAVPYRLLSRSSCSSPSLDSRRSHCEKDNEGNGLCPDETSRSDYPSAERTPKEDKMEDGGGAVKKNNARGGHHDQGGCPAGSSRHRAEARVSSAELSRPTRNRPIKRAELIALGRGAVLSSANEAARRATSGCGKPIGPRKGDLKKRRAAGLRRRFSRPGKRIADPPMSKGSV
ncbi:putative transmembrane protein [Crotalus adamanteus]|uniref:Transmembrane protein 107 n=1 Tax=Crotalus adamanteus TaxID=8729 RepID=A0AAW1B7X9_CROAD